MTGSRLNSLAAGAFGAVFVIVGLLGFTVSDGHDAAGHTGARPFQDRVLSFDDVCLS
jgi:hypothetical protein